VRLLLDTQILIWAVEDDRRLRPAFRDAIADPDNECWVSVAAWWEVGIKANSGRLDLMRPLPEYASEAVEALGLVELPVLRPHVIRATQLPLLHRDPFDRMLIGQALEEEMVLVTTDRQIRAYDCEFLNETA
jgi:PIN domain nuclease of toxin-antitoxin system